MQRSKDHEDVVRAVIGMGVAHEVEDISTGLAIDISIPELKIAVEVDGQSHFSRDASGRPLGRTAFKRRHLAAMGWTLFPFTPCDLHSAASYAARLQQLRALICERMEV
jgi:G:T-mismatch repair DNA endonuclease (very short patch repair protein)